MGTGAVNIVIGVFPLPSALLASLIAKLCGYRLDEAAADSCVVLGKDISGQIHSLDHAGTPQSERAETTA